MLPTRTFGDDGLLIVMLHWLGGSARTWDEVSGQLAEAGWRGVALDLPGFGDAAHVEPTDVQASVEAVIASIQALRKEAPDQPWLLAGHSMGGKLALLVARAARDGVEGLQHLSGLVLISPSPLSPEPMKESKRKELMETLGKSSGDEEADRKRARQFLEENTGKSPLDAMVRERCVDDLLRMNRAAFTAWLTDGSKADYAEPTGALELSSLVLCGSEETELGSQAQCKLVLPYLPFATLVELEGGGHLAPLERPAEVAARLVAFTQQLGLALHAPEERPSEAFQSLMNSPQTSGQTRRVMQARLQPGLHNPPPFESEQLLTLRALAQCVVPAARFDLADRILSWLQAGSRDGWRFDTLPCDLDAWKRGLASLQAAARREHSVPFLALTRECQHLLLQQAAKGKLGKGLLGSVGLGESANVFDAPQMQQWFEDVRSAAARLYIADPRTMDRIGFHGFADEFGFTQVTLPESKAATA